ncbi:MAG: hypothetical protein AB7S26_37080 [Sandaracinaceae bacterium]
MALSALATGSSGTAPWLRGVVRALDLPVPEIGADGRLIELAAGPASARTSVAAQILLAAQREGDLVAWVEGVGSTAFPPDLARAGLDLDALLFVRLRDEAGPAARPKAAEILMRTGAFGAIALDVSDVRLPRGQAWLGRLGTLARDRECRCVLLSGESESSLGSMVATRARVSRRRVRAGRFALETEALKHRSPEPLRFPGPRAWIGPEGLP